MEGYVLEKRVRGGAQKGTGCEEFVRTGTGENDGEDRIQGTQNKWFSVLAKGVLPCIIVASIVGAHHDRGAERKNRGLQRV